MSLQDHFLILDFWRTASCLQLSPIIRFSIDYTNSRRFNHSPSIFSCHFFLFFFEPSANTTQACYMTWMTIIDLILCLYIPYTLSTNDMCCVTNLFSWFYFLLLYFLFYQPTVCIQRWQLLYHSIIFNPSILIHFIFYNLCRFQTNIHFFINFYNYFFY
jgi:hypothetical protein